MNECNKCIHENVCDQSSRQMWSAMSGETNCSDFEDKAKYGDTMPKWISVKDALPDRQCEYLVRYGFGEPIIQSYSGVMYFVLYDERPHFENDGLYGLKVTHWMPLPSAPKED